MGARCRVCISLRNDGGRTWPRHQGGPARGTPARHRQGAHARTRRLSRSYRRDYAPFGRARVVANAIGAHHTEEPLACYAHLVAAADAMSVAVRVRAPDRGQPYGKLAEIEHIARASAAWAKPSPFRAGARFASTWKRIISTTWRGQARHGYRGTHFERDDFPGQIR